jgi:biopolymer transport protein ExbB
MNSSNIFRRVRAATFATLAAMTVGLIVAGPVQAAEWAHKKKIVFDTSETGANLKEDAQQVPLLVRLHSGNFNFKQAKPDGGDLRVFAADGKSPLKYHIESYDSANELANVWVTLPKLTANSKTDAVVLAWGNDKASTDGDSKASYDASQILVYHFSGADGVRDATANGNNASKSSAAPVATGQIGQGLSFKGSSSVVIPASASLKVTAAAGFSFTAWLNPVSVDAGTLWSLATGGKGLSVGLEAGKLKVTSAGATARSGTALKPGTWQHVAVVASGGKVSFYIDGIEAGTGSLALQDAAGEAVIGEGLRGDLDELTLAGTARSPSYIQVLASSQTADSLMIAVIDEGGGGEINYFKILISLQTIDGWIVIALLGVMAVISGWVMVDKTVMLRRAGRANARFLAIFGEKSFELLSPGHAEVVAVQSEPTHERSSVYRLYALGLKELAKRLAAQAQSGQPQRLSPAGQESIRAALDAAMLRENQRFNSGIVLLTIAISGGPFLGLLGTVVGVMITFAAIAAAGEVNVNSIAPGIAAALVATVAGLAVAIPALFGYNWLASQIKNISADSQVFVDEFITKAAELHAG